MTLSKTVETSLFIVAFGLGGYLAGSTAGGQGHHGAQAAMPAPVTAQRMLDHSRMAHTVFAIMPGSPVPQVRLAAHPDPVSGWNLQVMTEHFQFAPDRAGQPHVDGEGHAHLYIDGKKVSRLYGPWVHLGSLPAGPHRITVTLNTNAHDTYAVNGTAVAAQLTLGTDE